MRKFRFVELPKAIVLAWAILVFAGFANAQSGASLDDEDVKKSPTPPGLFITPTALHDAVQQDLNPGLTNYPNFVAGEAVKAVVSPDDNTLAILTAGMNSLYHPNTERNHERCRGCECRQICGSGNRDDIPCHPAWPRRLPAEIRGD